MHYKNNKELKPDGWRMDINRLSELVGRKPVDVEVLNRHVVCTFPPILTAMPNGHTQLGGVTIIRFRKW